MGRFSESIEHWVGDFLTSTAGELEARVFGERAASVLVAFLENACGSEVAPDEISEANIRDGVAIGIAPLALEGAERHAVPALLQSFLAYCESAGRLSGGEALGNFARVTATAHLLKKQTRKATIKVGPNEPCPCGSGRKYKKCCMRL
jgi:uncharacterized protein YchJ